MKESKETLYKIFTNTRCVWKVITGLIYGCCSSRSVHSCCVPIGWIASDILMEAFVRFYATSLYSFSTCIFTTIVAYGQRKPCQMWIASEASQQTQVLSISTPPRYLLSGHASVVQSIFKAPLTKSRVLKVHRF